MAPFKAETFRMSGENFTTHEGTINGQGNIALSPPVGGKLYANESVVDTAPVATYYPPEGKSAHMTFFVDGAAADIPLVALGYLLRVTWNKE